MNVSDLERAKGLLIHYFRRIHLQAGIPWDAKNMIEVEAIVDFIVGAARHETFLILEQRDE